MNRKIAIIGAGPAGLTCALELRDQGFTDVTVLGHPGEAQYRKVTVGGVSTDVGACYLHAGYWKTVGRLIRRYGLTLEFLGDADLMDERCAPVRIARAARLRAYVQTARLMLSSLKCLALHRTEASRAYGIPMDEFLQKRGLGTLRNSFILGPGGSAQGYGYFDRVTAYGALRWLRPSLFLTVLTARFKRGVGRISETYADLFAKILADFPHEACTVKSVTPRQTDAGALQVDLETGDGRTLTYDQVVIACRLEHLRSPASPIIDGSFTSSRLFRFVWTSSEAAKFRDRVYFQHHLSAQAFDSLLTVRFCGRTDSGEYLYYGIGYVGEGTSAEDLEQKVRRQVLEICQLPIGTVHVFDQLDYNCRFTAEAIANGVHLEVNRIQGLEGVWYSGGALSHWDINSIYEFNRRLVLQMRRQCSAPTLTNRLEFAFRAGILALQEL